MQSSCPLPHAKTPAPMQTIVKSVPHSCLVQAVLHGVVEVSGGWLGDGCSDWREAGEERTAAH